SRVNLAYSPLDPYLTTRGAARCVRKLIPGASKHLPRELALSGSWSRYLAPTCTRRLWEDDTPTAMVAPHSVSDITMNGLAAAKQAARQAALGNRRGLDAGPAGVALAGHVLRECP